MTTEGTYLGHRLSKILSFMADVEAASSHSKDLSTKVGAVALGKHLNILSKGWNGFPRGVNDDVPERHERPAKYNWTCHAEMNLVAQAAMVGTPLDGSMVLIDRLFPCHICAGFLIQSGVKHIFAPRSSHEPWKSEQAEVETKLREAGVGYTFIKKEGDTWVEDKG